MRSTIRYHLRNLKYTLLNVSGLSVGIAVFILLILFIRYENRFDSFHENRERIYRVEHIMKEGDMPEKMVGCPAPLGPALVKVFPEIEEMTRVFITRKFRRFEVKKTDNQIFQLDPLYVDQAFFRIFSFPLVRTASNTPLTNPFSIVLTEEAAELIFGSEDPIGKVLENDNNLYTVTGIMENVPGNSHVQFNSLCSMSTFQALDPEDDPFSWSDNWLSVYIMLDQNSDMATVNSKLKNILRLLWKESTDNELYLQPLERVHLYSDINSDYAVKGDIKDVILLIIIAFTVLIMAGVNYANLAVAQSIKYSRYTALHKINGASSGALVRQTILESMTVIVASLFISVILVMILLPLFNTVVGRELTIYHLVDPLSLGLIITSVVILGLLSALYPALVIKRMNPVIILRGTVNPRTGRNLPRSVLMVFQYVISAVLLLSTIVIIRQVKYMTNIELGYNDSNMIRVELPDPSWQGYELLRGRIINNPLILGMTGHDYPVNNSTDFCRVGWDGSGQGEYLPIGVNYVDNNFLGLYEMVLTEGNGFLGSSPDLSIENNQVILNEEAIRVLNLEDPVGKRIYYGSDYRGRLNGRQATIAGVVKDFHYQSAHDQIKPFMIRLLNNQQPPRSLSIKTDSGNEEAALSLIREAFESTFPDEVFSYHFVGDYYKSMYTQESRLEKVVMMMSALAIFIACLGVLGLVSYSASQRRREVGIRKTQGASATNILLMFSREFFVLLFIAFVVSLPVSQIVISKWMSSFPYRVSFSIHPVIFSLGFICIVTLVTIGLGVNSIIRQSPTDILSQRE